jgi:hypothetical protein
MPKNIRDWIFYKYQPFNWNFNGPKEPAFGVLAVGPNRTTTLDKLPSSVISMITVQAKSKADAYRIGVQKGGL